MLQPLFSPRSFFTPVGTLAFVNTTTEPEATFRRESMIVAAAGAGTFVFAFQVSALLAALPVMRSFLQPPLSTEWIMTVYLLCLSTLLLPLGKIGDLLGTKKVYLAGLAGFGCGSLVCAVASVPCLFLFGRAIQGVSAALVASNSPAILTRNLLRQNHGRALGWQAGMTYLGLTVGPAVSAYLISRGSWRAVFLIVLSFAFIAFLLAIYAVPPDKTRTINRFKFPLVNATAWFVFLMLLLLALSRGAQWGWRSPRTGGLLLLSFAALIVFVAAQGRSRDPLVEPALFQSRIFSAALLNELLFYIALYAIGFLVPILVVRGRGLAAAWTGVLLTTQSVLRMCIAPIGGLASDRYGTRVIIFLGSTLFASGALILICVSGNGPVSTLVVGMAMIGLGTGAFVPANSSQLLKEAHRDHQGTAAGALATARNLGMMLGVAIAAAVYSSSLPALAGKTGELSATRTGLGVVLLIAAATLAIGRISGRPGPLRQEIERLAPATRSQSTLHQIENSLKP
jgi:MFS family permease